MKSRLSTLFLVLFASITFYACIDDDSTYQSILLRDKEAIEDYLAENPISGDKEYVDDQTGFRVIWSEVSESGIKAEYGDTVSVNYIGRFLSDEVFDTSYEDVAIENDIYNEGRNYGPIKFLQGYGSLIPGFEAGVSLMEVGDIATVLMPSAYAYGTSGAPEAGIPANTPVIFEIEFVDVKEGTQQQ